MRSGGAVTRVTNRARMPWRLRGAVAHTTHRAGPLRAGRDLDFTIHFRIRRFGEDVVAVARRMIRVPATVSVGISGLGGVSMMEKNAIFALPLDASAA